MKTLEKILDFTFNKVFPTLFGIAAVTVASIITLNIVFVW